MEMKEKRVHDNIIRERKEEMNVEEQKGDNRGISTDLIWLFPLKSFEMDFHAYPQPDALEYPFR